MGSEVIGSRFLTLQEVRKILEDKKKSNKDEELTYEQKVTLEFAKEFGKGKVDSALKLVEKIKEMGVDEETAVSLVNVKPTTPELVKLFFEKSRYELDDAKVKEIISLFKED